MEDVYSPAHVVYLLENYCDIKSGMTGSLPKSSGDQTVYIDTPNPNDPRELPFGAKAGDFIPYREMKRATPPRDGKQKGRNIEAMHVAVYDIEEGIRYLSHTDYMLIRRHYIEGWPSVELAQLLGVSQSALNRMYEVVVQRLTDAMNGQAR